MKSFAEKCRPKRSFNISLHNTFRFKNFLCPLDVAQINRGFSTESRPDRSISLTMEKSNTKEVDIYRETPLRLMGYANEVGEAFRALIHVRWVRLSYGVSSAYVLADTYDKSIKMNRSLRSEDPEKKKKVALAAMDTLLWQAFASVIVPGFTINRICAFSLMGLSKTLPKLPLSTRKWATTFIGLGAIPFIVHPIDTIVHLTMDKTTRKYFGGASAEDY